MWSVEICHRSNNSNTQYKVIARNKCYYYSKSENTEELVFEYAMLWLALLGDFCPERLWYIVNDREMTIINQNSKEKCGQNNN